MFPFYVALLMAPLWFARDIDTRYKICAWVATPFLSLLLILYNNPEKLTFSDDSTENTFVFLKFFSVLVANCFLALPPRFYKNISMMKVSMWIFILNMCEAISAGLFRGHLLNPLNGVLLCLALFYGDSVTQSMKNFTGIFQLDFLWSLNYVLWDAIYVFQMETQLGLFGLIHAALPLVLCSIENKPTEYRKYRGGSLIYAVLLSIYLTSSGLRTVLCSPGFMLTPWFVSIISCVNVLNLCHSAYLLASALQKNASLEFPARTEIVKTPGSSL